MANKVAIITDSTVNLPEGAMEEYNIQTVSLIIHWDDKSYIDQVELTTKEFYERLANSKTNAKHFSTQHLCVCRGVSTPH
jgi:fatty acid-binding protein DegV